MKSKHVWLREGLSSCLTCTFSFQCLMPEILTPQIEGLSEEALKERIHLRKVKDSVGLFDQLVQAGV